ncbi:alpha/beta fold hydrolase [Amycolatopsis taiwanensis]|uniref:alpha/beta fold hydrolase n=1 Tax=Amycolatopsis taiwanensis TaxID=342230 RepID=UPI000488CD8A|nr:alpha/beta hydrolase [Amycolatopsis taiwanensis]
MNARIDAPARLGETGLPDGRRLAWAEWGPDNGTAVLLIPGAATSRWLGLTSGVVESVGARLISVDRPGLGASSPFPGRTFQDFAADIEHFTETRGFRRPPVIANSQGAPFALACAASGQAGPLAIVSAADEIAAPEFTELLPDDLRALVELVASDPAAAEATFAGFDADAMWRLVTQGSPQSDLAVYRAPAFEDAYRRALTEAFSQGAAAGYARDTVLAMGRWPFDLSAITSPVDVWYGAEDRSHSPDNGETLARRIPRAHRRLVPDIGGAVLWTHTEQILRSLLSHDA